MSRAELEARVRELERENAALRTQSQTDRDLLTSMILSDLPQNEQEYEEFVANSSSLSDLLREMEAKFGLEPPK